MQGLRSYFSILGLALAAEAFAVWALFALPRFTGRAAIREAWDSEAYWLYGMPALLASLVIAGALARQTPPWLLALYAAAGHALATAIIAKSGADLGLLPLAVMFVGAPLFALFAACAWVGRWIGRRVVAR